ncbi:MAG: hypothetical protein PHY16_15770 [Methylobacter sp.]|nr:hypothetical protein [Methylobacter sp.]
MFQIVLVIVVVAILNPVPAAAPFIVKSPAQSRFLPAGNYTLKNVINEFTYELQPVVIVKSCIKIYIQQAETNVICKLTVISMPANLTSAPNNVETRDPMEVCMPLDYQCVEARAVSCGKKTRAHLTAI